MITKLKIKITKNILERSKMCSSEYNDLVRNCAIALAVRDIFPKAKVDLSSISPFGVDAASSCINLSNRVTKWIEKFDSLEPNRRVKMKEFEFEIEIPSYVVRKVNIDEIRPLLINHSTLELVENK